MTDDFNTTETRNDNRPDYVAVCYHMVQMSNGWRRRKSVVGAAWIKDNGSLCFRPAGKQVIEDDIYFYPANDDREGESEAISQMAA